MITKMCYECALLKNSCEGVAVMNTKLGKPCSRYKLDEDEPQAEPDESETEQAQPQAIDNNIQIAPDGLGTDTVKHQNFIRLATKRLDVVIEKLRILNNCGNKGNYESTYAEREQIRNTLRKLIEGLFDE